MRSGWHLADRCRDRNQTVVVRRYVEDLAFVIDGTPQVHPLAGVAIDGSRFKAVNTRDKNYTHGAIERRMEQVEASIARYLSALDTADRQEGQVAEADRKASCRERV
jgi:hypothetical protein